MVTSIHDIAQAGVLSVEEVLDPWKKQNRDSTTFLAIVDDVYFIDDPRNNSKGVNDQVQYECTLIGGPNHGCKVYNVADATGGGSAYGFSEKVIAPARDAASKVGPNRPDPTKTKGSWVTLTYLGGNKQAPVITGRYSSPQKNTAATAADGVRWIEEFNGIQWGVDKNGSFFVKTMGGAPDENGNYTDSAGAGSFITIAANGDVSIGDGEQSITISKKTSSGIKGKQFMVESSGPVEIKAGGETYISGSQVSIGGGMVAIAGGGNPAARMYDMVMGTDMSTGATIMGQIITGSGQTLIGG